MDLTVWTLVLVIVVVRDIPSETGICRGWGLGGGGPFLTFG